MNNFSLILFGFILFFSSCGQSKKTHWEFKETISLPAGVHPLSIAFENDEIWLSDPEKNRVLKVNKQYEITDSITGLQRPMNITFFDGKLYIPEYLSDRILVITGDAYDSLVITHRPNAPASVDLSASQIAVADFYNHRIILKDKHHEVVFGNEGSNQGEFHYPTSVKLYNNQIYVADAYNNRVQIFDSNGGFKGVIGDKSAINVASGLDVYENTVAVTDQENNRVLIFDLEGNQLQVLTEKINYPTDVFLTENELWVANFKINELTIFIKTPI